MSRAKWPRRSWSHAFYHWVARKDQVVQEATEEREPKWYTDVDAKAFFKDL